MDRGYQWQLAKEFTLKRDNFRCTRCGAEYKSKRKVDAEVIFKSNLVVDHIIPVTLNGDQYNPQNLQTLCLDCNKKKNAWDQSMIARNKRMARKLYPEFTKRDR